MVLFMSSPRQNSDKNARGAKIGPKNRAKNAVVAIDQFALKARHIDIGGNRTTIALEQAFWREVDQHAERAGQSWQHWIEYALEGRTDNIGKARWLRVLLLAIDKKDSYAPQVSINAL